MTKLTSKGKYKKYIAVASVAALCMGAAGALPIMANTNPVAYKLANVLGMDKTLDDYTTMVNKVVEDKGVSVGLGEVLYDQEGDVLMVTNYLSLEQALENPEDLLKNTSLHTKVYINGEELNVSSSVEAKLMDDNTVAIVTKYNTPGDLVGKNDVTLKLRQLFVNDKEYRGNWDMAFSMDSTMFNEAAQKVEINETLKGLAGDVAILKYVQNPLEQSIYYTQDSNSFIELRGTDNNGNEVVFETASGVYDSEYKFVLAPGYEIQKDATSLSLELFEKEELPLEVQEVTIEENGESTKTADIAEEFTATGEVVTIALP